MIKNGEPYTATQIASFLGLSRMQVSNLRKDGVLTMLPNKKYPAKAITEYCEYSRGQRKGVPASRREGNTNTNEERARLLRAQAEKTEMDNDVRRGELAPVELLTEACADGFGQCVAILEALPNELKRNNPGLSAKDIEIVKREVAKLRNIAAEVKLDCTSNK